MVFVMTCVAMIACRSERKVTPDVPGDEASIDSFSSEGDSVALEYRLWNGLFTVGRSVLSFRACSNPATDYAVVDSSGKMKDLYRTVVENSPAFPYEYVYVEVKGRLIPADAALQQRGFDSALVVAEVFTFEQKNYQNACIPYDFWAMGDEWSLQISMREGILVLKDFRSREVHVFEYFAPSSKGEEVYTYASNNYATQSSVKAVIKRQECSDDAGNRFDYSASVLIDGRRYTGCAIKGN